MPTEDPIGGPYVPYTPTPQPANLRELIKLIRAIIKDYKKQPVKPGAKRCPRCGLMLEVMGFEGHKPIYGCSTCNWQ